MTGQCDSCGFKTEVKKFEDRFPGGKGGIQAEGNLCGICANTPAGNAFFYPANHLDNADTLKMIAYVGNMILKAIGKR